MSDNGFEIAENGNSEIDSFRVRDFLEVSELKIDKSDGVVFSAKSYVKTPNGIAEYMASNADGGILVREDCHITVMYPKDEVTPVDKRRAFLSRLGALLREFDVYLIAHSDLPLSAYFNNAEGYEPFASIGKEQNKGCGFVIEADNVMDFESE